MHAEHSHRAHTVYTETHAGHSHRAHTTETRAEHRHRDMIHHLPEHGAVPWGGETASIMP
eukprot:3794887-Alexandrium_andersonii.AAC.1